MVDKRPPYKWYSDRLLGQILTHVTLRIYLSDLNSKFEYRNSKQTLMPLQGTTKHENEFRNYFRVKYKYQITKIEKLGLLPFKFWSLETFDFLSLFRISDFVLRTYE